jgi:hypothetical protein
VNARQPAGASVEKGSTDCSSPARSGALSQARRGQATGTGGAPAGPAAERGGELAEAEETRQQSRAFDLVEISFHVDQQ